MNEILSKTEYLLQILFYIIQGFFSQVGEREFFVNFWKTCIAKTRNGESQTACKLPY